MDVWEKGDRPVNDSDSFRRGPFVTEEFCYPDCRFCFFSSDKSMGALTALWAREWPLYAQKSGIRPNISLDVVNGGIVRWRRNGEKPLRAFFAIETAWRHRR